MIFGNWKVTGQLFIACLVLFIISFVLSKFGYMDRVNTFVANNKAGSTLIILILSIIGLTIGSIVAERGKNKKRQDDGLER